MNTAKIADAIISRTYRALSQEQRDKRQESHQALYDRLFAEIEDEERTEYEDQFGAEYRARHPFKLDGARTHAKVVKRMQEL